SNPDMSHSWKMTKKISPVTDDKSRNLMYCCMGYPGSDNCDGHYPYSKTCDAFMGELCKNNPYLDECQCINRNKNFQYQKIKNTITNNYGDMKDECWYPACKPGSKAYIP